MTTIEAVQPPMPSDVAEISVNTPVDRVPGLTPCSRKLRYILIRVLQIFIYMLLFILLYSLNNRT